MPTYNDEKYLKEAIDDILAQTYKNFELIIVNDGSTDNTQQVLDKYAAQDNRIKVFKKENGGTGSALNYGFSKATGEFGTWVSSDDNKKPHFIERLVTFLQKNRDIEFVCSTFKSMHAQKIFKPYIIREDGSVVIDITGKRNDGSTTNKVLIADDWVHINGVQCFLGVCFMYTMRLQRRCGDYITIPGEDYHMTMKMALNSRAAYIDENLGTHNNPEDSLSMQNRSCVDEAISITKKLYRDSKKWHMNKIPKISNFYWGSEKMSYMRYMTIKSFKKFNPDWSVHLYMPKHVSTEKTWKDVDGFHKQDSSDIKLEEDYLPRLLEEEAVKVIKVDFTGSIYENASEAHKGDVVRWNTLYNVGGMWSDMDIIHIKSINELFQNNSQSELDTDSIVCFDHRHESLPAIGCTITRPGNKLFQDIIANMASHYDPLKYESIGSRLFQKIAPNMQEIQNKYNVKVSNLDVNAFFLYDWNNLDKVYESNNFSELYNNSIGLHWYGGHPSSRDFNAKLNHKNYHNFNNTLTEAIKHVIS